MRKTYFTLLMALALLLCACAPKPMEDSTAPSPTTASETGEDVIICTINSQNIMRSEYEPVFNMYYQYYSQYYDMTNEESLKELQDLIFDNLVRAEIIFQNAQNAGLALTSEEESSILEAVEVDYGTLLEQAKTMAAQEGATDIDARADEIISESILTSGMTLAEFKEKSAEDRRKTHLMDKLYEQVTAQISYSEQEAAAEFAQELEAQREAFSNNPADYETALTNYENQGGIPPLFIPEGYVRVKHILVGTEEESKGIYERLNKGEDFDALMAEVGTDPGMQNEPNMSQGYLMGPGTPFDPKFKEVGFALVNVGDYSEPFESSYDYGWHIVRLVEIVESRETAFSELKEEYMKAKLVSLQEEYFANEVQKWTDEAEVTSYIGRIRDLGKVS